MISFSSLLGGDNGISQTVALIKQAVYFSLREPQQRIRKRAESILRIAGSREGNSMDEVKGIFQWVTARFHYVHDPQGMEYVKSPEVIDDEITASGTFYGDCDDVSVYLAALLKVIGYTVQLVTMNSSDATHSEFQHIYVRVLVPRRKSVMGDAANGEPWIALDGTAKSKPFAWSAPAKRLRTYDV